MIQNNPFQLRDSHGLLCIFPTPQIGIRHGLDMIRLYMSGYNGLTEKFNTTEKICRQWANMMEIDAADLLRQVTSLTGIPPHQKIAFRQRKFVVAIADAIIRMEPAYNVPVEVIESAYDLL